MLKLFMKKIIKYFYLNSKINFYFEPITGGGLFECGVITAGTSRGFITQGTSRVRI